MMLAVDCNVLTVCNGSTSVDGDKGFCNFLSGSNGYCQYCSEITAGCTEITTASGEKACKDVCKG